MRIGRRRCEGEEWEERKEVEEKEDDEGAEVGVVKEEAKS